MLHMMEADLKRKIRKLKQSEKAIRFGSSVKADEPLVWDTYFNLNNAPNSKARYSLNQLAAMSREDYRQVIEEYYAHVYYRFYTENDIVVKSYNEELLSELGLPYDADEAAVKKRFRELAMKHHPDKGGDPAEFITLMNVYKKLLNPV